MNFTLIIVLALIALFVLVYHARNLNSEAIRVNPGCPASVRVGLGLCCYKLGQIDRAQAAMARALELDPQNVQALVGSAILELSTASAGSANAARRTENAVSTISMAYHVDRTNAMALNHLANHYFWTWSVLKGTVSVEAGSRRGLMNSDLNEDLLPGDFIRIGVGFTTTVGDQSFDGRTLHLGKEYAGPSGEALKLYRKDYRKVRSSFVLVWISSFFLFRFDAHARLNLNCCA